jgi:hypothetical protein
MFPCFLRQSLVYGSGTINFQVIYSGDSLNNPSTSNAVPITANVGDFTLTTQSPLVAIKSGDSGTATISVAALQISGFNGPNSYQQLTGPVAFTCATSSPSVACSLSAATVDLSSDPSILTNTTLTINTQATTSASNSNNTSPHAITQIVGAGGSLLAWALFWMPGRKRRFKSLVLMLLMSVSLGIGLVGCGSSKSKSVIPPTKTGAAPGTYTATVTAVASGVTHAIQLKVVVQ